jgi:hypothetical protein
MQLTFGTWTDIFTNASSSSGDPFGFNLGGDYFAPLGYTAGQSLSGSLTFANTDLVTMGFTPDSIGVFSGAGTPSRSRFPLSRSRRPSACSPPSRLPQASASCGGGGEGRIQRVDKADSREHLAT